MLFKHPFTSAVMFLSLSATSSNANVHNYTSRPSSRYPTAEIPITYDVSIPQLPPSGVILVHDAKKILNFVVRSLPHHRNNNNDRKGKTTSTYESVAEPTAVSDLRRAVTKVEKSALSEDDWKRIQRLIRSIIEEYGNPVVATEEETEPTIVNTVVGAASNVVGATKEAVEGMVSKRTPGQVMATAMLVSAIAYESACLLFL